MILKGIRVFRIPKPFVAHFTPCKHLSTTTKTVSNIQNSEIIYSGKLGGFANGAYAHVNFEKMDLLCVYQLSEDKTFTIIPIEKS